ncbi:MAG: hypothetical protein SWJ54_13135 [Cyanobacteriota bacterium]|nr:hypothetical protein [Cyanobacteriota bacterium]
MLNSKGVTPDSTLNSTPSHRTQTEPSPETFSKPKESPEPQPEPELPKRGRPKAKRSDPNFTQISAYIRKETHRKVKMKLLEIESDQDLSELVEQLLQGWLSESS